MSAAAVVVLAEARRLLGGEYDPLRGVWDSKASEKDRRLLLALAGVSGVDARRLVGRAWSDLRPEVRADIASGLRRFSGWAAKLEGRPC